jgi:glycosyltransferase involved in cell wall biosynthesis
MNLWDWLFLKQWHETPLVTRKGGIPLAVKDGYNGFYQPRNSHDMAEKINLLLKMNLRLKMGKRAAKLPLKFSWEMIAHRFENIYQKLLTSITQNKIITCYY